MAEHNTVNGSMNAANAPRELTQETAPVRVWDLSVRVFHWCIVALVPALYFTAKQGGEAMEYHALMGYLMLWLVLFRLLWGFLGTRYARFSNFLYHPKVVIGYLGSTIRKVHPMYMGHNPVGGLSVLAIISLLITQVFTGLFANDDVLLEGPLAVMVSGELSSTLTWLHKQSFEILLYFLALHLAAIFFYRFYLHSNLLTPMITGDKYISQNDAAPGKLERAYPSVLVWTTTAAATLFIIYLPDLMRSLG
jgi:cytochrome b